MPAYNTSKTTLTVVARPATSLRRAQTDPQRSPVFENRAVVWLDQCQARRVRMLATSACERIDNIGKACPLHIVCRPRHECEVGRS